MRLYSAISRFSIGFTLIAILAACGGDPPKGVPEAQPMAQKQRWYWMGSTSYQKHVRPANPENYWVEIEGEHVVLQADCNHASAKSSSTHEGRLWISGITTARVACPAGSLENTFIKQLADARLTEQRGDVLRIDLNQYGETMFFSRDPKGRFSSYLCERGDTLAMIAQVRTLNIWLADQFRIVKEEGDNKLTVQENNNKVNLDDGGEALAANCRKLSP